MKSVVLEKHELENRDEATSQTIVATVVFQNSDTKIFIVFFRANTLQREEFLTAT